MDIRGISSGNSSEGHISRVRGNTTKIDTSAALPPGQHHTDDVGSTSSREITRLAAELRRLPEVRDDIVTLVSQRLAAGEYETKQSASETAEAVLREGFV
jgi:hypothetical protein